MLLVYNSLSKAIENANIYLAGASARIEIPQGSIRTVQLFTYVGLKPMPRMTVTIQGRAEILSNIRIRGIYELIGR